MEIFNHLHANPEISWEETETTKYVAETLQGLGYRVTTFDDCTGVIAEIGKGKPTVGLRTDMDALWQKVDGKWQANHSCGHDAHMSMGLGVAMMLKDLPLPGTVRLIFQPAEEKGAGALKMIEKKVIDDLDYLFGVHLRPELEVPDGKAAPAIVHGAGEIICGKIIGEDGHGGRPHLGANAIEVASAIVEQMKGVYLNPLVPYSVKMTKLMAGGENGNIIPGNAEFTIDLRAQTNVVRRKLKERLIKIIDNLADLYEVKITYYTESQMVAAEVNEEAQAIMAEAIDEVLGKENVAPPSISTGCEDFHNYSVQRPNVKTTMLGLGCGLTPGLHHPYMTFNSDALMSGVDILTKSILKAFDRMQINKMEEE